MRNPTTNECQAVEAIYRETQELAENLNGRPQYHDQGVKFTILHARLHVAPDLLLVGDRPNLRRVPQLPAVLPTDDSRSLWSGDYVLALMTTAMFERAGRLPLLNGSQFFDTNFFSKLRSDTADEDAEAFTMETRNFSLPHFRTLVQLVNPRAIVTLGETAFRTTVGVGGRFTDFVRRIGAHWYDTIPGIQRIPVFPIVHPSWAPKQPELYRLSIGQLQAI